MARANDPKFFQGNNKLNSKMAYYYRLLYSVMTNPQISTYKNLNPNVTNFDYAERTMYGRVDRDRISILPREGLLKELKMPGGPAKLVRNLNFVADAYEAFVYEFTKATNARKISSDEGWMSRPKAIKGYVSPTTHYAEYRAAVFDLFVTYLDEKRLHRKIIDFDSFFVYFMSFIKENAANIPFTLEAYTRSHLGEPHFSALAIDLAKQDASEDKKKIEVYENLNYAFYQNAAMQHGFSIDKNAPWRIVADLGSPAMQAYMANRGYKSITDVLEGCYEKTYISGYNIFKTMVLAYYNQYVDIAQTVTVPALTSDREYVSKQIIRKPVDMIEFHKQRGEKWFLNLYITVRNYEEKQMFTREKIDLITDRCWEIIKVRGPEEALKHANLQLSDTTRRSGSDAERWHRRKKEENEEKELQNRKKPGTIGS